MHDLVTAASQQQLATRLLYKSMTTVLSDSTAQHLVACKHKIRKRIARSVNENYSISPAMFSVWMLYAFFTPSTFLVFITFFVLIFYFTRKRSTLPPGPRGYPFVGNIFQMGPIPMIALAKLRKRYGDIYSIYMGRRPTVVLNGNKVIKNALVKHANTFNGRPHNLDVDKATELTGIVSSSGKMWQEQRQVAFTILRQFGMGKAIMETKIHEEISVFLDVIGERQNEAQDLHLIIETSVSNIICNIVFGRRFEHNDALFVKHLKQVNLVLKNLTGLGLTLFNVFPILRLLPGDLFKHRQTLSAMKNIEEELIWPMIDDHLKNYDENNSADFIEAYIKEMKKRQEQGEDTTMSEYTLMKVLWDFFSAGTETTATALRWILVIFLNYPEIQQKCFEEVEEHIGVNRVPSIKDKLNTPYLEATLMEVLRFFNIAALGVTHAVTEDIVFEGYMLPKGTSIMVNLDSVLNDPEVWGDPRSFRPERFLDESARVVKPDEFIPFMSGRRQCLGEALARAEMFLFTTSMLQRYEFVCPPGEKPSMQGNVAATHNPHAFKVVVKPRA